MHACPYLKWGCHCGDFHRTQYHSLLKVLNISCQIYPNQKKKNKHKNKKQKKEKKKKKKEEVEKKKKTHSGFHFAHLRRKSKLLNGCMQRSPMQYLSK
jgi:hypothetical protein